MKIFLKTLLKAFEKERPNVWLWLPIFFGFGVAFYFSFSANFLEKLPLFLSLFCAATILLIHNRSLIILSCAIFLAGGFYAQIYEEPDPITAKMYVDVVGKVKSVSKFTNPINGVEGVNLVIAKPTLSKITDYKKKNPKLSKSSPRRRGSRANKLDPRLRGNDVRSRDDVMRKVNNKKSSRRKKRKKKINKKLINLTGYQEFDRKLLNYRDAYQQDIPEGLEKISVILIRNHSLVSVNDKISFRAFLQPPKRKDFASDFDAILNARIKKIAAYGFVSGEAKILEKNEISNFDQWFLHLREKIKQKIFSTLHGDKAAIAAAFLIGDRSQISKESAKKIRNSGLSHLLSISGFHLSLAGAIFFISLRFLLARNEYLALNFDLKKIAAGVAIFAVYFYLKIAGSPLPAQRAFLFVFFTLIALFFSEKLNAKRATMFGALLLILLNPYIVFSASFQLSFAAILVLISFSQPGRNYFWQIFSLSILVQIATIPFLMHHFRDVSLLGFAANVTAIPLASFLVMPFGFLAIILMPLGLEKPALLLMNLGISSLEIIYDFVAGLSYSHLASPWLSSFGLSISIIGLLLICLTKSHLRLIGIAIFLASFLTVFLAKKPDVIFEQNQRFFAIYDKENGLIFSKKRRPSKQRRYWMKQFDEREFKILPTTPLCGKDFCNIEIKNTKILVLLRRNKISEICKNDFDVIVNLTKKYRLPDCVGSNKIKIDNEDFYKNGTQFLFLKD